MRILDVNSSYSPTGGGIRKYHDRKLEYFAAAKDDVAALAVPGTCDSLAEVSGSRVYSLRSIPLFVPGYRMIVDSGGLCSVINDFRPDIMEVGSPYILPRLARAAAGSLRLPIVGFYHTDFPDSYVLPYAEKILPSFLTRRLHALALRHVQRTFGAMTAVFAASRCMLQKLSDLGLRRLFHTPLGVDTDTFGPHARSEEFRRSLGVSSGGILLLYLARLHWEKGLDTLMEAYPLFRDPARIKLVIGGRGPHDRMVDDFIGRWPEVARLPYQGSVRDVAKVMASSDIFLALGKYETFGLAGLEAISCGTLPVFPDRGASAEMAMELELVPPFEAGSRADLAEKVGIAVEILQSDPVDRLRDYAVSRHSWGEVFCRIRGFYRRIIDASASGDMESLEPPGDWWE